MSAPKNNTKQIPFLHRCGKKRKYTAVVADAQSIHPHIAFQDSKLITNKTGTNGPQTRRPSRVSPLNQYPYPAYQPNDGIALCLTGIMPVAHTDGRSFDPSSDSPPPPPLPLRAKSSLKIKKDKTCHASLGFAPVLWILFRMLSLFMRGVARKKSAAKNKKTGTSYFRFKTAAQRKQRRCTA